MMRKKGLDILRAIAVILVVCRHCDLGDSLIRQFGWLGVDLFFVLSGFLVSGLLFTQYKRNGTVDVKRFLGRRAFKIFPPFYAFLLLSLAFGHFVDGATYEPSRLLSEIFYMQSYVPGIFLHTWTLAVEEHFYVLLALTTFIIVRTKVISRPRVMITVLLMLLVGSLLWRCAISYPHRHDETFGFVATHLRADGIIMGVLLSYLHHFTSATEKWRAYSLPLFIVSMLLMIPGLLYKGGSFVMNTYGLSLVNLGFAILVLLSLDVDRLLQRPALRFLHSPVSLLCFIGINSYSIYLWHLNSRRLVDAVFDFSSLVMTGLTITLAITWGVVMSYAIEKTSLRLRDRLYRRRKVDVVDG